MSKSCLQRNPSRKCHGCRILAWLIYACIQCLPHLAAGLGDIFALPVACLCFLRSHGTSCNACNQPPDRRVRSKGDACEAPVQARSAVQLRHTGSHDGDYGAPVTKFLTSVPCCSAMPVGQYHHNMHNCLKPETIVTCVPRAKGF